MLKLAWDFTIHTSTHDAIWSVRIDALNGKILENNDVISCSFDRNNTHSAENLPIEKIGNATYKQIFIKRLKYKVDRTV
jgi:hypothetical protein